MAKENAPKDAWDKAVKLANMVAIIAIPVVLGVYGNVVSKKISDEETKLAYVELAVSIIVEASETPDPGELELIDWATGILGTHAGLTLTEAGRIALAKRDMLPTRFALNHRPDRNLDAASGNGVTWDPTTHVLVERNRLTNIAAPQLRVLGLRPNTFEPINPP